MTLALLPDLTVRLLTPRHFLDPAHPSERETVSSTVAAHTCECPSCSMNTPNPNQAVFSQHHHVTHPVRNAGGGHKIHESCEVHHAVPL